MGALYSHAMGSLERLLQFGWSPGGSNDPQRRERHQEDTHCSYATVDAYNCIKLNPSWGQGPSAAQGFNSTVPPIPVKVSDGCSQRAGCPYGYFTYRSLRGTAFLKTVTKQHLETRSGVEFCSSALGHIRDFPLLHHTSFQRGGSTKWKCFCCCFLDMFKYLQINIPLSTPHAHACNLRIQEAEAGL